MSPNMDLASSSFFGIWSSAPGWVAHGRAPGAAAGADGATGAVAGSAGFGAADGAAAGAGTDGDGGGHGLGLGLAAGGGIADDGRVGWVHRAVRRIGRVGQQQVQFGQRGDAGVALVLGQNYRAGGHIGIGGHPL